MRGVAACRLARTLAVLCVLAWTTAGSRAEPDLTARTRAGATAAPTPGLPDLPALPPLRPRPPATLPTDDAENPANAPVPGSDAGEPLLAAVPFGPLRIVSWHLDDAKAAGALNMLPDPDRAWRHTFGAERRTAPANTFDAAALDADVVLLQGVRRISDARILFPARDWRLIVSRQMLSPVLKPRAANRFLLDEVVPGRPATTAIAVRFKRGLRVAGQAHITEVVVPVETPIDSRAPRETPAALAVRLLVDRKPLWVVSADLAAACPAGVGSCGADDALLRWFGQQDTQVLAGGTTAAAHGGCAHQTIALSYPHVLARGAAAAGIGCIARASWT